MDIESDLLTHTLSRLAEPEPSDAIPSRTVGIPGLPRTLDSYIDGREMRWLAPGVSSIPLIKSADTTVRLVRFRANIEIPEHDHIGPEYVVVLKGVLHEDDRAFSRGDVAVAGAGHQHRQRTSMDADCTALVMNVGRLVPRTFRGWLMGLIAS